MGLGRGGRRQVREIREEVDVVGRRVQADERHGRARLVPAHAAGQLEQDDAERHVDDRIRKTPTVGEPRRGRRIDAEGVGYDQRHDGDPRGDVLSHARGQVEPVHRHGVGHRARGQPRVDEVVVERVVQPREVGDQLSGEGQRCVVGRVGVVVVVLRVGADKRGGDRGHPHAVDTIVGGRVIGAEVHRPANVCARGASVRAVERRIRGRRIASVVDAAPDRVAGHVRRLALGPAGPRAIRHALVIVGVLGVVPGAVGVEDVAVVDAGAHRHGARVFGASRLVSFRRRGAGRAGGGVRVSGLVRGFGRPRGFGVRTTPVIVSTRGDREGQQDRHQWS